MSDFENGKGWARPTPHATRPGHEWPSQRGQKPLSGEILPPRRMAALAKADPSKVGLEEFTGGLSLLNRALALRIAGRETRGQLGSAVAEIVATRMRTEIFRSHLLGNEARKMLLADHERRMGEITREIGRISNEAVANLSEDYLNSFSETARWQERISKSINLELEQGLISQDMAEIKRADLDHVAALRTQVGRTFLELAAQDGMAKIKAAMSRGDFDGMSGSQGRL